VIAAPVAPVELRSEPGAEARSGSASTATARATQFVEERLPAATRLGSELAELAGDPEALARTLDSALDELSDPIYQREQSRVAPGIGPVHGVRLPLLTAVRRAFDRQTKRDSSASLILLADRLLRQPTMEPRWFAIGVLDRTLKIEPERTWQLLRRAAREAADWITIDTLAHPVGRGILREPYRWAELEQLVISPSRWERRLVASTIATMPFADRKAGRAPEVAQRGLEILGTLIGDADPEVQKALSWAYRSMTVVDPEATAKALESEARQAQKAHDGLRAWVIRDALPKLPPERGAAIRTQLDGLRRRPDAQPTSRAAELAHRFAGMGLGRATPEPPL
jgi:3-methyladenine DNA glycosylase AlkD